ncbi:dipeptide ABC transporter ATP-binding protein [Microlunatus sp. Y2014]|uniref:dipeptide ABC transporter ATP-binding protein n=1 Tax=Microlunatus sp. Y2014 TaxID=3418488 RepID=UPI003DA7A12E
MTTTTGRTVATPDQPAADPKTLLSIQDLRVVFRDRRKVENVAVDSFSAEIREGEHLAIVGESGSGKTVTMRSLMQLLPGTATVTGSAYFKGEELLGKRRDQMQKYRGRRIGMIFQNPSQAFNPTIPLKRQLTEHLGWHGIYDKKEALERAIDTLDRVGIPDPAQRINLYPFQLSGGMLQRAMIAQAIVAEPELLIADEPTTAVDVTLQRQVLDLLLRLGTEGLTMAVITHDLGVARYMCENVIVMQHGKIVERGGMRNFAENAQTDYAKRLLDAALDVDADPVEQKRQRDRVNLLTAHSLTKVFDGAAGEVTAVDSVDVEIGTGEAVGVVGESGSGKSTLARLLLRLIEPTSGEVTFADIDLLAANRRTMQTVRRDVQMVFQNPYASLLPQLTIAENVIEPLRLHRVGSKRQRRKRTLELLEQVGIPRNRADHYPRQFSGGQQQRVAIARALALEPKLLVCDEPTSALDVSIQAEILELLAELRRELNLSLLFITHNLGVAQEVCDRVIVMTQGNIVESAPTDVLFSKPSHSYTRALLSAVLPAKGDPLPWQPVGKLDLTGQELVEVADRHWVRTEPDHSDVPDEVLVQEQLEAEEPTG